MPSASTTFVSLVKLCRVGRVPYAARRRVGLTSQTSLPGLYTGTIFADVASRS